MLYSNKVWFMIKLYPTFGYGEGGGWGQGSTLMVQSLGDLSQYRQTSVKQAPRQVLG